MESDLRFPVTVPPLAARAYAKATELGFGADGGDSSSRPGVGALLSVLAASKRAGRIAELGTGLGAGAAWLLNGMDGESHLITAEADPSRSAAARALLSVDDRADVLTGRWEELLPPLGPFDLVFVDSGYSRRLHDEQAAGFLLDLLVVGGLLVLDDLTPESNTAAAGVIDSKREFALRHPRVLGAELYPPALDGPLGGARSGLLVMTKIS